MKISLRLYLEARKTYSNIPLLFKSVFDNMISLKIQFIIGIEYFLPLVIL